MANEALSEVDQLKKEVERLKKEIEFKDAIIARLQAAAVVAISTASSSSKPLPGDTVVVTRPLDKALQCSVCLECFTGPFTVECGHSFCYACISDWVAINKSCPSCRTKLLRRPTFSYSLSAQVDQSIERLPEPERTKMKQRVKEEMDRIKRSEDKGDLWGKFFKPLSLEGLGNIIVDKEDGVRYGGCLFLIFCRNEHSNGNRKDYQGLIILI